MMLKPALFMRNEFKREGTIMAYRGRNLTHEEWAKAFPESIFNGQAIIFGGRRSSIEAEISAHKPHGTGPGAAPELGQARRAISAPPNFAPAFGGYPSEDGRPSTYQMAHGWLEDLLQYTADPRAPASMHADLATIRRWVGAEEGATKFTDRQHEQFARGFERYMMEGVAPSRALAEVFAKFKQWLTAIYQTVDKLRVPMNDEIRGVYDRMLSAHPEKVIAPERAAARGLHDIHEADVAGTPPERAVGTADILRGERDEIAEGAPISTPSAGTPEELRKIAETQRGWRF
jgi:hypothetical protein